MTEPITTIDRRFSMPQARPTSWADTEQILLDAQMSWISTVRADGRPHVTPLVAVWLDGALYFTTGFHEQKYRNLQANPYVVVTTGNATWNGGVDAIVEGKAVPLHDEIELTRVAAAFGGKWDGDSWHYSVENGHFAQHDAGSNDGVESEVFKVTPTKVFAQAKGNFGQTRHRF
ncbi:pyridoxamine 5'-phosphate oxidase family protein [Planctomonas sp. JC2975]|uniref:pyridoxamine 5'-phosphate oxidase family protein n=1 Tax=Planctomonas sp. JC2975 TaxID=2729626 RepID=UPI001473D3BE|nr:pyridoxamine 5'-phosphate oxidase family protein [Planctomonas sp. JC2975]NNC11609.1 pyridoxamine 5'-phosphate oxidase family protein [Planctomonas sp. JC2975]